MDNRLEKKGQSTEVDWVERRLTFVQNGSRKGAEIQGTWTTCLVQRYIGWVCRRISQFPGKRPTNPQLEKTSAKLLLSILSRWCLECLLKYLLGIFLIGVIGFNCKRMSLRSVSILCVKNINFSKINFMRLIHPVFTDSHKGKSVYKVKCPYHSIVKKSSLAHSFCLHSTKSNILTNFIS